MKDVSRYLETGELGRLAYKPKDKVSIGVELEGDSTSVSPIENFESTTFIPLSYHWVKLFHHPQYLSSFISALGLPVHRWVISQLKLLERWDILFFLFYV